MIVSVTLDSIVNVEAGKINEEFMVTGVEACVGLTSPGVVLKVTVEPLELVETVTVDMLVMVIVAVDAEIPAQLKSVLVEAGPTDVMSPELAGQEYSSAQMVTLAMGHTPPLQLVVIWVTEQVPTDKGLEVPDAAGVRVLLLTNGAVA